MFKESFLLDWKSIREGSKVVKKQRIVGVKPDVEALLAQLEGEDDEAAEAAVVED